MIPIKKILLISFLFLSHYGQNLPIMGNTTQSNYCEGWETGYCEGWRDVNGDWALCPITPLCPLEKLNQTRYLDGYNRGFKKGSKDAKK